MAPQGTPKRPQPKDKHKKQSWIKRDAARKALQAAHEEWSRMEQQVPAPGQMLKERILGKD